MTALQGLDQAYLAQYYAQSSLQMQMLQNNAQVNHQNNLGLFNSIGRLF